MTMSSVIANRIRVVGNDLQDYTDVTGLLLLRAPNRYRKMISDDLRDCQPHMIALQQQEFGVHQEWIAAGITATIDNDWALLWERAA